MKKSFLIFINFFYVIICLSSSDKDSIDIYNKLVTATNSIAVNLDSAEIQLRKVKAACINGKYNRLLAVANKQLGVATARKGNLQEGVELTQEALNYFMHIKDTNSIINTYVNLGIMYSISKDFEGAKDIYNKAIALAGHKQAWQLGQLYGSRGLANKELKDMKAAERDLLLGKEASEAMNDTLTLMTTYSNLASIYSDIGDIEKAKEYLKACNLLLKYKNDEHQKAMNYAALANIYRSEGDFNNAEESFLLSILALKRIKEVDGLQKVYKTVSKFYEENNKFTEALFYYKTSTDLKDSMLNDQSIRSINELNVKFETKEKEQQLMLQKAEIDKQQIEAEKERTQRYALLFGLGIVILFSIFLFNRIRVIRKQKNVIAKQKNIVEEQKLIVDEKNKEITDSIVYAKRIQSAILPPSKLVKEYLPNSFILYQPKDIVAGDFYWMEHKGNNILFAAADCTGHGVPGAMVSVVCNNGLNRSVREYGLTNPVEILNKTREIVIKEFEKSEEEVQDGMDISLCVLDQKTNQLQWAGANNPLWIIREGSDTIEEIKGDKQPIGKYANEKPFTPHSIQLNKGDSIYIFTDGYQDQFGGDNGKKFKPSALRKLLLAINDKGMDTQHKLLNEEFEKWKGDLEQVDDVCVIGVRF